MIYGKADTPKFVPVMGERVDIGEGVDAFVSGSHDETRDSLWKCWRVTDCESGFRMSDICSTKKGAIESARDIFAAAGGLDAYRECKQRKIEKWGRSPLYDR